jgi:hypothetical protein
LSSGSGFRPTMENKKPSAHLFPWGVTRRGNIGGEKEEYHPWRKRPCRAMMSA